MKKLFTIGILLSSLIYFSWILLSCSSDQNSKEVAGDIAYDDISTDQEFPDNDFEATTIKRKIIKEGDVRFKTADVKETRAMIVKTVKELSGYLAQDDIYHYGTSIEHQLEIRIPADNFDKLLSKISENVEKLESKNINALDVTEEYIDVEARINTKKELENRFKELLKQARTIDEILSVESEIGKLRTEIESYEGRLRYLKDRIDLSTLRVTYYQETDDVFGFGSKFGNALKRGWENLLYFFIGLTHIWPFMIIAAAGIYLFRRIRKRKKNK